MIWKLGKDLFIWALVLGLVIAFPAMLWRDDAQAGPGAATAAPKSDEALGRMLEQQLDALPAQK